jgi:hypothetical protein
VAELERAEGVREAEEAGGVKLTLLNNPLPSRTGKL